MQNNKEEGVAAMEISVEQKVISISNPDKLIWPEKGITKEDYISYLIEMAPYILPYTIDWMLMTWHYPNGIRESKVEKRSVPKQAPPWISQVEYKSKNRILLNNWVTLVWLAQFAFYSRPIK
jgi:bifunctional non-homologous end joining protein LigD